MSNLNSISFFSYRFTRPHILFCLLALLALTLFIFLGFWQIHRAEEKQTILKRHEQASQMQAFEWYETSVLDKTFELFEPVHGHGHLLKQSFYLDNQYWNHALGYYVLSALLMADGRVVLIDRGFVPRQKDRFALPQVEDTREQDGGPSLAYIEFSGQIYLPSSKSWVLGPSLEVVDANRAIIQTYDLVAISQFLQKPVYPFIIRLHPDHKLCFECQWAYVSFKPERHYGYAFQWFCFAFVVLVLFVALNTQKIKSHPSR